MKKVPIVAVAILALSSTVGVDGRVPPDLSGKWTLVVSAAHGRGGAGANGLGAAGPDNGGAKPVCGQDVTLVQTPEVLMVQRKLGERSLAAAFRLDGTHTKHPVMGCRVLSPSMEREAGYVGAPTEMTADINWDGAKLVMRTALVGTTVETKQVLALQADGTLLVETTSGQTPQPVRLIYRKK